jgi:glycosyltransferase involved in cell wall biosynthesis
VATALVLVRNEVTHDTRVLREARVLRDMGYDVLVAGVVSQRERTTEFELDGVRVIRLVGPRSLVRSLLRRPGRREVGHPPPDDDSGRTERADGERRLRRLLVTLAFNIQGAALAWRIAPELIHANDYDTMWIGVAAKLLRRSRLLYDAHELWPDQDGDLGWRPWLIACEGLFVRVADATTTVSPGCAEAMAARYHVEPPIVVRNLPEQPAQLEARQSDGPLAVYVGVIAPHRGLEEAIAALARVPELRLRLVGADSNGFAAQLHERAERIGVGDRVDVWPPVPPSEVAAAIADSDMGLVLIQPTSLSHRMSLPNKLFEYTAAGVPVLATELPMMGPLVREEGIGEVVPPGDVEAIASAMRRLLDPARNAEVHERVRSFNERVNWQEERRVLEEVYARLRPRPAWQ